MNNPLALSRLAAFTNLGHALRRLKPVTTRLDGKTVVLTGATGGIGRAAAEQLADLGADLVLVGRNRESLERTRSELADAPGTIDTERADLASMAEVATLATRLASRDRIDVLINNAGALFREREETAEGLERTFALNLLSPYLLTTRLIPRLVDDAAGRIVTVSSGGMYGQRIRVRDLQFERPDYGGAAAYARAKRGQMILTEHWAAQLYGTGAVAHAMHPGWVDTPGIESALPRFRTLMRPLLRSAAAGADTITWLAAAPEPATTSGGFWLDRSLQPTHLVDGTKASAGDRDELIDRLEELAARYG